MSGVDEHRGVDEHNSNKIWNALQIYRCSWDGSGYDANNRFVKTIRTRSVQLIGAREKGLQPCVNYDRTADIVLQKIREACFLILYIYIY